MNLPDNKILPTDDEKLLKNSDKKNFGESNSENLSKNSENYSEKNFDELDPKNLKKIITKNAKKILKTRESILFHTSIDAKHSHEIKRGVEILGEEIRGLTLSQSFEYFYGLHWSKKTTIRELHFFSKYPDFLDEIEQQRAFTRTYLEGVLELGLDNGTLRKILIILEKRGLLYKIIWNGNAKRTMSTAIYLTNNATLQDIEDTLRGYVIQDFGWYEKQVQLKKYKKKQRTSKKELKKIWKDQSDAAKELRSDINKNKPLPKKEKASLILANKEISALTANIDNLQEIKTNRHSYIEIDPSGSTYDAVCDCFNLKKEPCERFIELERKIRDYKFEILLIIRKQPPKVADKLYTSVETYLFDV